MRGHFDDGSYIEITAVYPPDPDPLTILDDADGEEPYIQPQRANPTEITVWPAWIGQAAVLLICAALLVTLWWVNRP